MQPIVAVDDSYEPVGQAPVYANMPQSSAVGATGKARCPDPVYENTRCSDPAYENTAPLSSVVIEIREEKFTENIAINPFKVFI